jgi:hypothetical protein
VETQEKRERLRKGAERLVKAEAGDIADLIITLVERNIKQTCRFNAKVIGLAI